MRSKTMPPLMCALLLAQLWLAGGAWAQTAPPQNPTQFDVTGFIQAATLDTPGDVLSGGTITVNNQVITVPRNTILQMPAAALTWQQVFACAPPPYGPATLAPVPACGSPTATTQTGLALRDVPAPLRTYEVHVQGNRVDNTYIAGLMFLAQSSLQSGQGFINWIDLTTGEFRVGGIIGDATTGQRVKINDPAGRFGRLWTPDSRFTIDENNPTVRSETGYPMCLPRSAADALCPQVNRPPDLTSPSGFAMVFTMLPVPANGVVPAGTPDPRLMAPFEVGDYVTYSGILVNDPAPATTTYIAAHQVIANVGLFTAPGSSPAYVATDVMLLGVGGTTVAGFTEATIRTRFEGFTTDPSRHILLYGIDVDGCTGAPTPRNWGAIGIDPGPPLGVVLGRWRFRPPCKGATLADVNDKTCLMASAGTFLPPTREMRAVIETATGSGVPAPPVVTTNGLTAGLYQAPIFEFLFPENAAIGTPIVPNNFESFPFLTSGSGPLDPTLPVSATNPVVGQLSPWPLGAAAPAAPPVCAAAPVPNAAPVAKVVATPSSTLLTGKTVTLDGSGSTGTGLTFLWSNLPAGVRVTNVTSATLSFTTPSVTVKTTFPNITLTVTDSIGQKSTATISLTVVPSSIVQTPTAKAVALPNPVFSGHTVTLDGSGSSDTNGLPLTYNWTQSGSPTVALTPKAGTPTSAPTATFTAPVVAVPTTLTFNLQVNNGVKTANLATPLLVTVNPADTITFTVVTYRASQQRLTVDATSTNPAALLTLLAWGDAAETISLGSTPMPVNTTLLPPSPEGILVGVPQPDHVTVTSTFGAVARSPILTLR